MEEVGVVSKNIYKTECFRNGKLVWEEEVQNRVVNQGLNDILAKYFKGSSYTAGHYAGLKGSGSISAGDTLASHSAWSEVSNYSGSRQKLVLSNPSGQSMNNSSNKSSFNITGTATVAGIMIATVASGSSGVLYGAADFPTARQVLSGDTLVVTVTLTQQSA